MINNLGQVLLKRLHELKEANGGKIDVHDADKVVNNFLDIIKVHVNSSDDIQILDEIKKISDIIRNTKDNLVSIGVDTDDANCPLATDQLKDVTTAAEKSAEDILQSTEEIQKIISTITDEEIKKSINQQCAKIFESCSFQDLTGQRISKVLKTLHDVEVIVIELLKHYKVTNKSLNNNSQSSPKEEVKLHGPQLLNAPSQQDIDNLFDSI